MWVWDGDSRLDGLGDGADLVDLEQEAVAGLDVHGLLDALGVGHGQVVPDDLDAGRAVELGPCCPVVLVKAILDGHNCGDEQEKYTVEPRYKEVRYHKILLYYNKVILLVPTLYKCIFVFVPR